MRKTITASTAAVIALTITMSAAPAYAAPDTVSNPPETPIEQIQQTQQKEDFLAKINIIDSKETQTIEVSKSHTTLNQALAAQGLIAENFRSAADEPIDENYVISDNERIEIYQSEITGKSEVVKLPRLEIEELSESLYVGQSEVKTEGKDGKALKTTVTINDLSADKKVNKDAKDRESVTVEEKLTVTVLPEAKVVLIGTKVRAASRSTERLPVGNEKKRKKIASKSDSALIKLVLDQVGKPYIWATAGPKSFDCSGLVYWIYVTHGPMKSLPRTSGAQGRAGTQIDKKDMLPGDLIWDDGHIGIYVGDGMMVHAARPGRGVVLDPVDWFLDKGMKISRL